MGVLDNKALAEAGIFFLFASSTKVAGKNRAGRYFRQSEICFKIPAFL
jgi:hypothetical protein